MHEMPIAIEIVEQALDVAHRHEATVIDCIEVRIGPLRQIVSESLETAFRAASEGTPAEKARLEIIEEKIVAVCRNCECLFMPDISDFTCPRCGQADARIVAGNDIILSSLVCRTEKEAAAV